MTEYVYIHQHLPILYFMHWTERGDRV